MPNAAAFADEDRAFIEASSLFFLATADAEGQPDCSYKGGLPGFVRVTGAPSCPSELRRQTACSGAGQSPAQPAGRHCCSSISRKPRRLRVLGKASLHLEDPLLAQFAGAQAIVRVQAGQIFPNCPRYIHRMNGRAVGVRAGRRAPAAGPGLEAEPAFKEVLPRHD